jgi:hypothetical protein
VDHSPPGAPAILGATTCHTGGLRASVEEWRTREPGPASSQTMRPIVASSATSRGKDGETPAPDVPATSVTDTATPDRTAVKTVLRTEPNRAGDFRGLAVLAAFTPYAGIWTSDPRLLDLRARGRSGILGTTHVMDALSATGRSCSKISPGEVAPATRWGTDLQERLDLALVELERPAPDVELPDATLAVEHVGGGQGAEAPAEWLR